MIQAFLDCTATMAQGQNSLTIQLVTESDKHCHCHSGVRNWQNINKSNKSPDLIVTKSDKHNELINWSYSQVLQIKILQHGLKQMWGAVQLL